ncbi:MAG: hypothetical protein RIR97_1746 [Pseudomonadota bacterium]
MTHIWTETGFVDNDPWTVEPEGSGTESRQNALLPLADFLERIETSNDGGLGVLISPFDDVMRLKPYLDRIALIAVAFPAFNDGRAFSHASLLRGRLGYTGEIRATGDVLIDQIPLMLRCGITSFAVSNSTALARLAEGRLPGIDNHYQPTVVSEANPASYSWRRVAKPAA